MSASRTTLLSVLVAALGFAGAAQAQNISSPIQTGQRTEPLISASAPEPATPTGQKAQSSSPQPVAAPARTEASPSAPAPAKPRPRFYFDEQRAADMIRMSPL